MSYIDRDMKLLQGFKLLAVLIALLPALCLSTLAHSQTVTADSDLADFILIGERHGVEDQQIMIAALLLEAAKSGKNIGVVMEMISADQVELMETFRKLSPKSSQDFGAAIGWNKTSWPDYRYYAPIFEVIWARDIALAPGDPSEAEQARWRRGEYREDDYDPKGVLTRKVSAKVANAVETSWVNDMQKAHCGQLGETEAKDVARLQMMRDAYMMHQMRAMKAAGADIVVLIAGRAHIRRDRGVPLYLGEYADVQNIAVVEADPNEKEGETYQPVTAQADILPYDHILLTSPIEEKESVCARLKRKGLIK